MFKGSLMESKTGQLQLFSRSVSKSQMFLFWHIHKFDLINSIHGYEKKITKIQREVTTDWTESNWFGYREVF